MENKLIKYFLKLAPLTKDETAAITESMAVRKFIKGDFIVKEGYPNRDTFFIFEGLVRQYRMIDGEEITTNFYSEEQWIISLTDFSGDAISKDSLICVEDTTLVVGNEQKAQELFRRFPHFETVSRAVMEKVFSEQQKRMNFYLTDTPEQRYIRLLETQPDIFQRVPQYQIAGYIGVRPESLSRIRKRIVSKPQSLSGTSDAFKPFDD
jgi:CRP-like cAMP-binding protein